MPYEDNPNKIIPVNDNYIRRFLIGRHYRFTNSIEPTTTISRDNIGIPISRYQRIVDKANINYLNKIGKKLI